MHAGIEHCSTPADNTMSMSPTRTITMRSATMPRYATWARARYHVTSRRRTSSSLLPLPPTWRHDYTHQKAPVSVQYLFDFKLVFVPVTVDLYIARHLHPRALDGYVRDSVQTYRYASRETSSSVSCYDQLQTVGELLRSEFRHPNLGHL